MNKFFSIKSKLAIVTVLLLILQTLAVLWINYREITESAIETVESEQIVNTHGLQQYLGYLVQKGALSKVQETLAAQGADVNLDQAMLLDEKDDVMAASRISIIGYPVNVVVDEELFKELRMRMNTTRTSLRIEKWMSKDRTHLHIIAPVMLGKSSSDKLRIDRVGILFKRIDLSRVYRNLSMHILASSYPLVIILGMSALLVYVLVHILITRRISLLQEITNSYTFGEQQLFMEDNHSDEIGGLTRTFNHTIAELNRKHNEVLYNQDMLKMSQQIAMLGSWELDLRTNELKWSDETYRLFGYDAEKEPATYQRFIHAIHPDDIAMVETVYRVSITNNDDKYEVEHRIINQKTKEIRYVREECRHKRDEAGKIVRSVGMVLDITETKKNELELLKERHEIKRILDVMIDAVILIDERGSILSYNPAAEKMFGYKRSEVLGKNVAMLTAGISTEVHDGYIRRYLETGEKRIIGVGREVVGCRKGGEEFFIRLAISELPQHENEGRRFVGVCHDISREKFQEDQIRQAQKMDALGQLTGGIAHDFNNSLGVILGYADLIGEQTEADNRLHQYSEQITIAGERARKLTEKLLSFSKHGMQEKQLVDVNELLKTSRDMLAKTLTPKIQLVYELERQICKVKLDRSALEDAILNMSINSMHAMPEGGELRFETRFVAAGADEIKSLLLSDEDHMELRISDTGAGMDEQTRQKIFEPFFSTKGNKGTGLGMSQVYGFVKSSSGGIKIESAPGAGTSILIYLPCSGEDDNGLSDDISEHERQVSSGTESILVVDDEVQLCDLADSCLSSAGYTVTTANGGQDAVALLHDKSFDLLITDILMPGMDGYQLIEQALKINPRLPVLIVSGFDDKEDSHSYLLSEQIQRISKPYKLDDMLQKVRTLLDA